MGYIYLVTNILNNKRYVGQTIENDIESRWKKHKKKCKNSIGRYLLSAYNKYGITYFKFQIICICFDDDCNKYEEEYIKKFNSLAPNGYNLKKGGNNSKHHPDTIKLISEKRKGQKMSPVSEETRRLKSESMKGERNLNYGKIMSEEQKRKISETLKKTNKIRKESSSGNIILKPQILDNLKKGHFSNMKKVAQYNLDYEFITSYESLTAAAKAVNGIHSIVGKVCDEKKTSYKTYKGFIWKFLDENKLF